MSDHESVFVEFCSLHPNGVTEEQIKDRFPELNIQELSKIINELSKKRILQIMRHGETLLYRINESCDMGIMSQLTQEEQVILQHIKTTRNKGIWIRDLKSKTLLHQLVIAKCIKSLESKKIIKSVKSVKNPTKKIYMAYDMEPSIELTGGPWFSDNELDTEFITSLVEVMYSFIVSVNPFKDFTKNFGNIVSLSFLEDTSKLCTLEAMKEFVQSSGVSNIDLETCEISSLIDLLVYDNKVLSVMFTSPYTNREIQFYIPNFVNMHDANDPLISLPCGVCPVFAECSALGKITPRKCKYIHEDFI